MPTTVFFTGDVTVEVPDTTSIIDGGSIALSVQKPKATILSVVVGTAVTSITNFSGAAILTSVNFSNAISLQTIETETFKDCTQLPSIIIPANVTSIGEAAFFDCSSLQSVDFSNASSLVTLGDSVFKSCTILSSVNFPPKLTTIGNNAFQNCANLLSITIPASVTIIGQSAFNNCVKLSSIVWTDPAQSIFLYAFAFETNLVNSPGTVTYNQTYYNSDGSTNLPNGLNTVNGPAYVYFDLYTINYVFNTTVVFTGNVSKTVPSTTTTLNGGVIAGAFGFEKTDILSVVVGSAVTDIINFGYCTNLTSVDFSGASSFLTFTSSSVFFDCTSLTSVTFPVSLTNTGFNTFSGCNNLKSVYFSVTNVSQTIGEKTFQTTGSLASITIPESVTSMGNSVFYNNYALNTVTWANPTTITSFGTGVFTDYSDTAKTVTYYETYYNSSSDTNLPALLMPGGDPYAIYPVGSTITYTLDPLSFSVTYNRQGGSVPEPSTTSGIYGSKITINSTTLRSEYTFAGWNTVADGSGTTYQNGASFTIYANTNLYAQWAQAPGTPTNVTAVATGSTTANVSFTAPSSNGGSPIISYTATSSPGGIGATIFQSGSGTIPVTGLNANTEYTFTVYDSNGYYYSDISDPPSDPITTYRASGITSGVAPAGQTTIPVTNAQALGFAAGNKVIISDGTIQETITINSFGSIITDESLVNTYPLGSTLTQITAPGAPYDLSVVEGNAEVEINFSVDDGGSPITNMSYSTDGINFILFDPAQTTSPVTITGLINDDTYEISLKALNELGPGPASEEVSATPTFCFNKGTEILCLNKEGEEEYILVEHLKKGDLVKSYNHGYRKIDLILNKNMKNTPSSWHACMYKMAKTETNGLTKDLIVTGGHAILVDDLGEMKEANDKIFGGNTPQIDGKHLLLSSISKDFTKLENRNIYTWYHFVLENDDNYDRRFGVWANGILTETPSKNMLTQHFYFPRDQPTQKKSNTSQRPPPPTPRPSISKPKGRVPPSTISKPKSSMLPPPIPKPKSRMQLMTQGRKKTQVTNTSAGATVVSTLLPNDHLQRHRRR